MRVYVLHERVLPLATEPAYLGPFDKEIPKQTYTNTYTNIIYITKVQVEYFSSVVCRTLTRIPFSWVWVVVGGDQNQ